MPSVLSDPALSCFTNSGAHLRSILLVGEDTHQRSLALAERLASHTPRKIIRLPQHLTLHELEDFFGEHPAENSLYIANHLETRSEQFIARIFQEVARSGIVVMSIYPDAFERVRSFANKIDVIDMESDAIPNGDRNTLQSLCASSNVDRSVELLRRKCAESEITQYVIFPQILLRGIVLSKQEEASETKKKQERVESRPKTTDEQTFDVKDVDSTILKKNIKQEKKTQASSSEFSRSGKTAQKSGMRVSRKLQPRNIRHGRFSLYHTLMASAPYQHLRRINATEDLAVHLESTDIRKHPYISSSAHLSVIVLDSSGSMASAERIRYAKGLALSLAKHSYRKRTHLALIVARGEKAEIISHPTRSTSQIIYALRKTPTGGRTPLASGIENSLNIISFFRKKHRSSSSDVSIITDGRATIESTNTHFQRTLSQLQQYKTELHVIDTGREVAHAENFARTIGADFLQTKKA